MTGPIGTLPTPTPRTMPHTLRTLPVAAREHRRSCSRTEHSSAHIPLRLERGQGSWRPPAPASVACRTRLGRVYPGGTAVRDTELRLVRLASRFPGRSPERV